MRSTLALTAVAGALLLPCTVAAQTIVNSLETSGPAAVAGTTGTPAPSAAAGTPAVAAATPPPMTDAAEKKSDAGEAAEAIKPKPIPTTLVAKINLSTQRMEVLVDGQSKFVWPISSGRAGYASPRGTYRVNWTAKMWHSRKYDMAPMPHSVFFKDGFAIHATYAVGLLGRPASHGCIRLSPGNAATFYGLVQKHGNKATQIQLFGSSAGEQVAERRKSAPAVERQVQRREPSSPERVVQRRDRPAPTRVSVGSAGGNGYFPPGSPYYGRPAFVHNGVIYVKVR